MAEKLEDLNLPQAPVHKIIKDALPGKISVGRDVKAAMSRAASMFILYMTAQATEIAAKADRKTLLPKDIFEALEEAEFEDFVEPLKTALKAAKDKKDTKKADKASKKTATTENKSEDEGEADDDVEEEEDMNEDDE